jgi:hypothetical protein
MYKQDMKQHTVDKQHVPSFIQIQLEVQYSFFLQNF